MIRKLSTGNVMAFDAATRDLYLIDAEHTGASINSIEAARAAVGKGHGRHFSREALGKIQLALSEITILKTTT